MHLIAKENQMKFLQRFLFLIVVMTPTFAFTADLKKINAVGQITAVTVYSDRALVSRTASLKLKPGSYLVVFEGLPTLIQDDSVRVVGKGAAATIVGLETRKSFLAQSGETKVRELDEEILTLERRAASLDAKKAGLAAQKAFLDSIRVSWGERISKELAIGRPTSAQLLEASSFVGAGVTNAEEQSSSIDVEKKGIKDKIEALRRQRDEASGTNRKEVKSVEVMVDVAKEGTLKLELSSVIGRAGWTPAYDVRLAADAKSSELTFRAMVRQQTGEEWKNVAVTLSTARPSAGGAPPEMYPWRISFYRPQPPMASPMMSMAPAAPARAKKSKSIMKEMADEEYRVAEEAPAAFATAQVSDEQSSVSFTLPRNIDVAADGSQQGSVVAIEQLPVNMEYLAVPKLSPFVFLKSEIVNKASYPLLPGKVNTFVGNTFTGSSYLKKVASGEKFDLFFGTDDLVTVKREELKQRKEAGLFGKNKVSFRYRVELANFRKEPLTITLRDQLPLAGDEEIKVALDEPTVKPDEQKNDGTLVWKLPFKGGERKELNFGIMIEYPKDREISGL
jgi:uncharacterized protein (TIGR02231 family)